MLDRDCMHAAILPLEYSPLSLLTPATATSRTEYSLIIQNGNWAELYELLADPYNWFRENARRWHQVPFELRRPVSILLQPLSNSTNGVLMAASYKGIVLPEFSLKAKDRSKVSEVNFSPLPFIDDLLPLVIEANSSGYFHVECALDTDTVVISYLPPSQCKCSTPCNCSPCLSSRTPSAFSSGLTTVNVVSTNIKVGSVSTGRVHFDIGQNTSSTARDRAAMIHEYLAGSDGFCTQLNTICDDPMPHAFHSVVACVDEGQNLNLSPRGEVHFPKRFRKMTSTVKSKIPSGTSTVATLPTVFVQGMSVESGCYICVDTAILEDDSGFYPTDALYKLYCD